MIGRKGIVVAIGTNEVRGLLFSTFLGRTKVERTRRASSTDQVLAKFPSGVPITLLLPGYRFMARKVTLPFVDRKIIRKTLAFELEGALPLPADDILVDSVRSEASDEGNTVLALALSRKTVAECMALFPEQRQPARIIPDFMALLSLAVRLDHEGGGYGILHVDSGSATVVTLAGRHPVMMRSFKADGESPSIVEWLEATVKPHQNDANQIETLFVTGRAAHHAVPLLERVARVVPLPQTVTGVGSREWPAWSMLVGGAASASDFPHFNILGLSSDDGRFARSLRILSVGAGIIVLLGTADLYVRYASASQRVATLKAESRRVFLSAMPQVKNVVKEDAQLKVALTAEKQTREALLGTSSPSYVALSRDLGRLLVDHPEIKVREAALEGSRLTITGDGRGIGSEGLKKLLSGLAGAQDTQVEEITQGVEPNTYRFRVKIQVR